MALMKCPECGTEVSSKASSCVKCGHPIRVDKPRSRNETDNIWVRLGIILAATVGISYCVATNPQNGSGEGKSALEAEALGICSDAIERQLSYPATADYEFPFASEVDVKSKRVRIDQYLSAKNSYGVPTRFVSSCEVVDGELQSARLRNRD